MVDDDEHAAASGAFDSVVGRVDAQLSRGRPSGPVEAPDGPVVAAAPSSDLRGFRAGVLVGVLGAAVVVDLWLSVAMGRLAANTTAPTASRWVELVASAAWRWGMFAMLLGLAASGYVLFRRGRGWPLISAVVTALVVLGVTAYAVSFRVNELTGGWTYR